MKMLTVGFQGSYTYYDDKFNYMTTVGWLKSDDEALDYFEWILEWGPAWEVVSYVSRKIDVGGKEHYILPYRYKEGELWQIA